MFNNQLKKQAQLRESILAIVVMLVICYAGYTTFYAPKKKMSDEFTIKLTELIEKKTGLEKLTKTLQSSSEKLSQEMNKQAEIQSHQDPRVQMIQKYKDPVFKNVSAFLNAVTQNEFRAGLSIEGLKFDLSLEKKGYSETKFFINAHGKFSSVIDFINNLEKVPALLTLDIMNVQVHKNDVNSVSIDLTGTYYQLGNDNG